MREASATGGIFVSGFVQRRPPADGTWSANFELSGTALADFNCSGEARAMFMTPPQTLVGDPSPRQTSYRKNGDCVMSSQRRALVRGSDTP